MQSKNILILSLFSILSGVSMAQTMDNAIIYKYKDSKGNIIYSDNIPSNEKGQYSVLSGKSGVLKQVVEKELNSEEVEVLNQKKNEKSLFKFMYSGCFGFLRNNGKFLFI